MEKKDKTKVIVISQEEIDDYNKVFGKRIARKKRYGVSASQRKMKKNSV
ncbi:hypothetical protein J4429_05925 [Candidatus Pacearchaeota archaeon]|nr:hypothetical protein [Candidatus Pacearchaeota archaeon]